MCRKVREREAQQHPNSEDEVDHIRRVGFFGVVSDEGSRELVERWCEDDRHHRGGGLGEANGEMRDLLLAILGAYEARGEAELATKKLGTFLTARYGSVSEGKEKLGGLAAVKDAFRSMQKTLYSG